MILQDAAETEQPVPLVDEEEQEDLREGEGLFDAYHKRQKKDVGTNPAKPSLHLKATKPQAQMAFHVSCIKKSNITLCPYLHKMFTQAHIDGVLPSTLTEAVITVIDKKGRDPEEVSWSQDGKLFSKIWLFG